jgi:hypothetical protein
MGLWSLCNEPEKIKIFYGYNCKKDDILIVQNAYNLLPNYIANGWEILYDCRVPTPKKIIGMPLRHPPGYTFVVYRVR